MARGLAPAGARVQPGAGDTAGGHLGAGAFRVPFEPDHERSVDIGDPGAGDPGPRGRDCRGWRLSCGEAADHRRERGPDTNADGDVPRAVEAGSAGTHGRGPPARPRATRSIAFGVGIVGAAVAYVIMPWLIPFLYSSSFESAVTPARIQNGFPVFRYI